MSTAAAALVLALAAFTVPHVHAAFSWEQVISQSSMQSGDVSSLSLTSSIYRASCCTACPEPWSDHSLSCCALCPLRPSAPDRKYTSTYAIYHLKCPVDEALSWSVWLQLTSYGTGNDYQGACSYGANFANTVDLPWRTGTDLTLALNNDQFGGSAACGLCVMYRGLGSGLGTVPIPTNQWTFGLVTNM